MNLVLGYVMVLAIRHVPMVIIDALNVGRPRRLQGRRASPAALSWLPWIVAHGAGLIATWRGAAVPWQSSAGFFLVCFGAGLGLVSVFTLGKSYSHELVVYLDSRLVTEGVYGRFRHPLRFALFLEVTGACLLAGGLAIWLTLPALLSVQWLRSIEENGILVAAYGNAARSYIANVSPVPGARALRRIATRILRGSERVPSPSESPLPQPTKEPKVGHA